MPTIIKDIWNLKAGMEQFSRIKIGHKKDCGLKEELFLLIKLIICL